MSRNNENYSTENNSTRTVTPDCESVDRQEEQYDFSKLNNYLSDVIHPKELAKLLREIKESYLELSLYTLMVYADIKPLAALPHDNVQNHTNVLSKLVAFLETM